MDEEKLGVAVATALAAVMERKEVNAASVKLPTFSPEAPELWFRQVESHFRLKKITVSQTKYDHVLASVPHEVFAQVAVEDLSGHVDPYGELKKKFLAEYSLSPIDRVFKALELQGEGAKKTASKVLNLVRDIPDFTEVFVKAVLVKNTAEELQPLARSLAGQKLDVFVKSLADIEAKHGPVFSVKVEDKASHKEESEVNKLTKDGLCWKHAKFKAKAWRCADPRNCQFSKNGQRASAQGQAQ